MDTEKVLADLNRRFAAPLPEFYKRRIIFWKDEDREFEDKLDEITLTNAKLIVLTGKNISIRQSIIKWIRIIGNSTCSLRIA